MALHDGDLRVRGGQPLDVEELLALLDSVASRPAQEREQARACYFSSSAGWRDAEKHLGGAFASELGALTAAKEE